MLLFIPCVSIKTVGIHNGIGKFENLNVRARDGRKKWAWTCSSNVDLSSQPPRGSPSTNRTAELLSEIFNPPPRPITLVRRQIEQPFAVLMMRSGYKAVDVLDFVAMDEFQATFFDIRSIEWEKFLQNNRGIRQGNISDARYFDFISYAQMLTVQNFMRSPSVVFEEKVPVDPDRDGSGFKSIVVKRDMDKYATPQAILKGWRQIVGDELYNHIVKSVKRPLPISWKEHDVNTYEDKVLLLRKGLEDIYNYFYMAGFCLGVSWRDDDEGGGRLNKREDGNMLGTVEVIGPCILWGNQALARKKSIPNDYDCLCVEAFARRCGVHVEYAVKYSESAIFRSWKIV